MKNIYTLIVVVFFVGCSLFEEEEIDSSICHDGDCWVRLYTDFEEDSNGYHTVEPEWYSENSADLIFILNHHLQITDVNMEVLQL